MRRARPRGNKFLIGIVIIEFLFLLYEIYMRRVGFHDMAHFFCNVYFYVRGFVVEGSLPLWAPFMNYGKPMAWQYFIEDSDGLFFKLVPVLAGLIKGVPFFVFFQIGLFVERVFFLVGVWLLSRFYFRDTLTCFFVAMTACLTTILYAQPISGFYQFFCLPYVIYFLHIFFKTFQPRWLLLGVLFAVIQVSASHACYLAILILTLVFYFGMFFFFSPGVGKPVVICKDFKKWVVPIVLIIGVLGVLGWSFWVGKDPFIVQYADIRLNTWNVDLVQYLSYGGENNFFKWNETFLGVSPALDLNLYFGILGLCCAIIGAFCLKGRRQKTLLGTIVLLGLVSSASPLAVLVFYTVPFMSYFRHLGLLTPIMKLFLCFLSGFGFKAFFGNCLSKESHFQIRRPFIVGLFVLGSIGAVLGACVFSQKMNFWLLNLVHYSTPFPKAPFETWTLFFHPNILMAIVLELILLFVLIYTLSDKQWVSILVVAAVCVQLVDVFFYRAEQMKLKTSTAPVPFMELFRYQPLHLSLFRKLTPLECDNTKAFFSSQQLLRGGVYAIFNNVTQCESYDAFVFNGISRFLHDYYDAGNDRKDRDPLWKMSGVTRPQIQLFRNAVVLADAQIKKLIVKENFKPDMLLLSGTQGDISKAEDVRLNNYEEVPVKVQKFTPNELVLEVDNPLSASAWLYVAQNWHPQWKAQVNGKQTKVERAFLAYRAVRIDPGKNVVRFFYTQPQVVILKYIFCFLAGLVLVAAVFFI